ncbi:AmmeMemoRadiSam system protein B [Candidatus Omnitrophota bacterium]
MKSSIKSSLTIVIFSLFCGSIFAEGKIKHPNVSGQFYPGDKDSLSSQIDGFFEKVKGRSDLADKEVSAIIAPHAGYIYSGQVAAHAFKVLEGRDYDVVFVLAPSHQYAFSGLSVYEEGLFRTPLGDIEIDAGLAQSLILANPIIDFIPQAFAKEHSLEVELPFLQKTIDSLKIVPIVVGHIDYSDTVEVAKSIIEASQNKRVLVVASTDLSHYHAYDEALDLDSKVISFVEDLDALGLWQANIKRECEMCGLYPTLILLNYAKELGLKPKVLNYANSGDVTGDKSGVVGYLSVVFYRDSPEAYEEDKNPEGEEEMFNDTQKKRLLEIARQTITENVQNGIGSEIKEDDPQLNIKRGAFVTLHKTGDLRGCIGSFTSNEPICKLVSKMAIESATQDPRFSPVTKQELDDIDIEISVLTEPQLIDDWEKIRLGTDGVIVRKGFSSGVFLPQVAIETGWNLETFLSRLCWSKAGLPADCYKDSNTQIYTFQAFIFSENE